MAVPARARALDASIPPAADESRDTLRRHINLTRELALTQFKLKYTGSVLGYLWSLFKPAMLFSITYVVFAVIFNVGRNSPNFAMQLLMAIVLFTFFQEATAAAMGSIAGSGHLIRKAYFPRAILVVASTASAFMTFVINFTLIVAVAAPLGRLALGPRSLVAPLLIVELYVLVLGLSLLLASLFVSYRDLGHIWEVVTQLLMYGSAVVYPFILVEGHRILYHLLAVNPVAQIIEDMRHAVVAGGATTVVNGQTVVAVPWTESVLGWAYAVPFAIVALVLVAGVLTFRHLSPRFAENL